MLHPCPSPNLHVKMLKREHGANEMKMRMSLAIVAVCATLFIAPKEARSASIIGLGSYSCAEFVQLYASNPVRIEGEFFSWAQGFISMKNEADFGRANGMELNPAVFRIEDQKNFVRSWCAAHPTEAFYWAVQALYRRLSSMQRSR